MRCRNCNRGAGLQQRSGAFAYPRRRDASPRRRDLILGLRAATAVRSRRWRRPLSSRLLSLAALTILDAGPAGQIRAAAAAGFPSVGLRLMPLLATDARVVGDSAAEAEIVELLSATGMRVLEIGVFPIRPEMDWPTVAA